jgi:hypothetical protein
MSDLNYKYLDNFVAKTLYNTWNDQPDPVQNNRESPLTHWRIYEHDITPPSLIIKRNKLTIYLKSINNLEGLNAALLKSFKSNFLHKEIQSLQKEWKFTIDELSNSYTGTKLVPKQQITDLLNQTIDDHNDQFLENTNWDRNTEGQIPSRIPITMNKPHNNIMKLRERAIMSLSTHKCNMCNGNFRSHFQHELNDCAHPLRQNCRAQLWNSIEKHNHALSVFLKTLTTLQLTRVMAGLTQTESEETNVFLLKLTNEIYC